MFLWSNDNEERYIPILPLCPHYTPGPDAVARRQSKVQDAIAWMGGKYCLHKQSPTAAAPICVAGRWLNPGETIQEALNKLPVQEQVRSNLEQSYDNDSNWPEVDDAKLDDPRHGQASGLNWEGGRHE